MLGGNPTISRTKHRFLCQYPSKLLLRSSRLPLRMHRGETTILLAVDVVRLPLAIVRTCLENGYESSTYLLPDQIEVDLTK